MNSWDELVAAARDAALVAYAPYSRFRVGAALLGSDGRIHKGCNVENACYGLTLCAERAALVSAVADGVHGGPRIAVTCLDADPAGPATLRMPCGPCRQFMHELMGPAAEVFVDGVGVFAVRDLIPSAFELRSAP
jgi:cytidine deaminase